jgi:hypothetical protein
MSTISTEQIPAGHVAVTRTTNTYHRTRNGAWFGATSHTTAHIVPESEAARWVCGSSEFVSVKWPDGYTEHFDYAVTPIRFSHFGTPEQCKTEPIEFPAFVGTDGKQYDAWTSTRPLSRLGKVGYYRLEPAVAPQTTEGRP